MAAGGGLYYFLVESGSVFAAGVTSTLAARSHPRPFPPVPRFRVPARQARPPIMETVTYGSYRSIAEVPNLVDMQTKSYRDFLQPDAAPNKRKRQGLEALLREIFPIYSYDKTLCLEYVTYELGRRRYTP